MEAELAFGSQASEVFVVSIEVSNLTPQTYVLDTQQVVLLTADGGRANALSAQDSSLPTQPLRSQTLASRVATKGYLYYPAGEYVAAQGYLTAVEAKSVKAFMLSFSRVHPTNWKRGVGLRFAHPTYSPSIHHLPILVGLLILTALIGCTARTRPTTASAAPLYAAGYSHSAATALVSMEANLAAAQAEPLAELYGIADPNLSCDQAQQLAYRTVERMGYRVTGATKATQGQAGAIQAEQRRSGRIATVQVTLECQAQGVVVDAASLSTLDVASDKPHPLVTDYHEQEAPRLTENRPPPTTYFRRAFYSLFNGLADNVKRYGPEGQVYVDIRPLPPIEAELLFGVRTPDIFIIAVEVANRTPQTYVLDTRHVQLLSTGGVKIQALEEKDTPSLPPPIVSQALAAHVATQGYLYFPAGEYQRVQGYLTEVPSNEREGFQIEF